MAGGQTERLLLAAAADHQRNMFAEAGIGECLLGPVVLAVHRRALAGDHRQDDLQRLLELVETLGERAELETELVVLEFEPAGADTEDGPPLTDHVQRGDRLGQQGGVAVGVAGDQGAQLHVLRGGGQGAQRGIGLEHRLVGRAESGKLIEVVHHEDRVETCRLGLLCLGDDSGEEFGDAGAVREARDLETKLDRHPADINLRR